MKDKVKKIWNDPVWSKVISVGIVGGFLFLFKLSPAAALVLLIFGGGIWFIQPKIPKILRRAGKMGPIILGVGCAIGLIYSLVWYSQAEGFQPSQKLPISIYKFNGKTNYTNLPKIEIDRNQRLWLEQALQAFQQGKVMVPYVIQRQLGKSLPNNFDPKAFDHRLVTSENTITLLGILALDPTTDWATKVDVVLKYIRQVTIEDPKVDRLAVAEIAKQVNLTPADVSAAIDLARETGMSWAVAGTGGNFTADQYPKLYNDIQIGKEETFKFYEQYTGIEQALNSFAETGEQWRPGTQRTEYPAFTTKPADDYMLVVGNQGFKRTKEELEKGPAIPVQTGESGPFKMYLENGNLLVDTTVYAGSQNLPITIKRNQVSIPLRPDVDTNSSATAYEVVASGQVVFQMLLKPPNQVTVKGVFITPDGTRLIAVPPLFQIVGRDAKMPKYAPLKPIFKYPSTEFMGQYAN